MPPGPEWVKVVVSRLGEVIVVLPHLDGDDDAGDDGGDDDGGDDDDGDDGGDDDQVVVRPHRGNRRDKADVVSLLHSVA